MSLRINQVSDIGPWPSCFSCMRQLRQPHRSCCGIWEKIYAFKHKIYMYLLIFFFFFFKDISLGFSFLFSFCFFFCFSSRNIIPKFWPTFLHSVLTTSENKVSFKLQRTSGISFLKIFLYCSIFWYKILFLHNWNTWWIKNQETLKLGLKHWGHETYEVCSNNDPRLTFSFPTSRAYYMHVVKTCNIWHGYYINQEHWKISVSMSVDDITFVVLVTCIHIFRWHFQKCWADFFNEIYLNHCVV